MSHIYKGEDWMQADDGKPGTTWNPTRSQEQARVNRLYAEGKISRNDWSDRTDELGKVERWSASGRKVSSKGTATNAAL